jgi:hypothetical protein
MSKISSASVVHGSVETPNGTSEVQPSRHALLPGRRELPRGLVCRVLFGGPLVAFSWFFAAFGMMFVLIFLPTLDLGISTYDQQTTATVTHIERTDSSENDRPIYRVQYTFLDAAGAEHRGESYSTSPPSYVDSWRVDYRGGDPSESQLDGMRRRPFSAIALFVLIFPIVGLALVLWQLRIARRNLRLLRDGVETRGRLVDKRETAIHVNNVPIMALTFEYHVDGTRHTATVKTLTPARLEDDERESMLYDPHAPAHATTLDHLPGSPRVVPSGNLEAQPGMVIHLLIAPLAFVGLLAATVVRML